MRRKLGLFKYTSQNVVLTAFLSGCDVFIAKVANTADDAKRLFQAGGSMASNQMSLSKVKNNCELAIKKSHPSESKLTFGPDPTPDGYVLTVLADKKEIKCFANASGVVARLEVSNY